MAGYQEFCSFVTKFTNIWRSGGDSEHHVEVQAGKATVRLQAGLGYLCQDPANSHQQLKHRHLGPSRLRRRERRAAARNSKATEEVNNSIDKTPALIKSVHDVEDVIEAPAVEKAAVKKYNILNTEDDAEDEFCSDESYAAAEKHEPIGLEHFLEQLKKAADRDRERENEGGEKKRHRGL